MDRQNEDHGHSLREIGATQNGGMIDIFPRGRSPNRPLPMTITFLRHGQVSRWNTKRAQLLS